VTWRIEFERTAAKEFSSLDAEAKRRIRNFFQATNFDSRSSSDPGEAPNLWDVESLFAASKQ